LVLVLVLMLRLLRRLDRSLRNKGVDEIDQRSGIKLCASYLVPTLRLPAADVGGVWGCPLVLPPNEREQTKPTMLKALHV
jgi:hypothetical protein